MRYQFKSPPCIAELVDGEYVVINLDSGKYYNMVGLGAQVFQCLLEGVSVSALQSAVANEGFASNLNRFITHALDEGLLHPVDSNDTTELIPRLDNSAGIETLTINVYTDMQELLGLDPIHEVDSAQGWPTKS